MDMFNRLKSTVTGALPGNPVTREFDIHAHRASAGPGLLWKVYDGVKRSTKEDASVFVFEKKVLDRYSKRDKDIIIDSMKKGVSQLTKLRHPKILSVLHPLEESRESLAFATERVLASLANVLGNHDNLPSPPPADIKDYKLFDVEIRYGLLQVTEALTFLHNSVRIVHRNVCPEAVIINKSGAWKLAGFDFCIRNANSPEQEPFYPFAEWDPETPHVIQPQLDYLAPEHVITASCDVSSDMFSLGIVFYAVYNHGKTLFECRNEYPLYKSNVEELRRLRGSVLGSVPEEVRDHVKMLLNCEPSLRPDADQLSKVSFFEDVGAMTLQYLDSLFQRDNLQKSQFFKGLPKVLAKLPLRVSLQRVLPCLDQACAQPGMIPFVLPNILLVAEEASTQEYVRHVLPVLRPILQIREPIQITLIFMQNMSLLLSKTPAADITALVLPMVYRSLESDAAQIQELCLDIIPTFANLIEYSNMKNAIMPRIKKLCLKTTILSVRVNCLVCVGKLMEYMDKWYVLDEVFPILQEIPSREPAVLMSMLGIYKVALNHKKLGITKEVMANKVLPFLIPLSIDNNINLQQYNAFMAVIKDLMRRVEDEHRSKLEQLQTMKEEEKTIELKPDGTVLTHSPEHRKTDSMMDQFMSGFGVMTSQSASPVGDVSSSSAVTNGATPPPSKGSLSLEEKQRLVKEQENQIRHKHQPALTPKPAAGGATAVRQTSPASRDLTATLLSTNTGGVTSPVSSQSQGGINWSTASQQTRGFSSAAGSTPGYGGVNSMGSHGNQGLTQMSNMGAMQSGLGNMSLQSHNAPMYSPANQSMGGMFSSANTNTGGMFNATNQGTMFSAANQTSGGIFMATNQNNAFSVGQQQGFPAMNAGMVAAPMMQQRPQGMPGMGVAPAQQTAGVLQPTPARPPATAAPVSAKNHLDDLLG